MEERFLHASTVIESLRDNGYNNTAYALAELIDNSIQAKADRVELGFIEEQVGGTAERRTYNVTEISIWDNGIGMSPEGLRQAMQFGGSLNRLDPDGMGKFGMGLPNSSISQCRRVDVWSWIDGETPYHTYLDIDEMKEGKLEVIPTPTQKNIPDKYRNTFFTQMPKSGTLIIWSDLDRLSWKTGQSNFRHCEFLVGRMYRRYLEDDRVKIYSITYRPTEKNSLEEIKRSFFKANDPMYLMKNTSLPSLPGKYRNEAFFQLLDEVIIPIDYKELDGSRVQGDVRIKTSIAKEPIARYILEQEESKGALGTTKWGRHCAKNIGVSVMRAGRELALRDSFISPDNRQYKARYIGIEIDFPPSLDRLFGVTNNKQDAVKLIPYDILALANEAGCTLEADYLKMLKEEDDSLLHILNVVSKLEIEVRKAETKVDSLPVTLKAFKKLESNLTEDSADKATAGSKKREQTRSTATTGEPIDLPGLTELIVNSGTSDSEAEKIAQQILAREVKFYINVASRDSEAFFDVSTKKGMTLVTFNSNHIFYNDFISELEDDQRVILETAIAGYAQVMNEMTDKKQVYFMNVVRRRWGEVINDFLDTDSFDEISDI